MRWARGRGASCAVRAAHGLALLAGAAHAQGGAPVAEPTILETVVVTGSHIRRTDTEGALPLQVIHREDVDRSGATSVEQVLQLVPANVNGQTMAQTVGNGDRPGLATANLRGLGSGATLVLLNGRRLANYAFDGESVDLNSIPLAAIERVEVLRDGASAIYGTDAIAGVVNFILRKDYAGLTVSGNFSATQHGGGNEGDFNITAGVGDPQRDGYNVFVSASYQKQQALYARDRDFSSTTYRPDQGVNLLSGFTFPANIIDRPRQRTLNPARTDGCMPPRSLPFEPPPFFTPACGFDFATATSLLPETERVSGMLRGTWRVNESVDVFAEVIVGRNTFETAIAPFVLPAVASTFGQTIYPADGPYYPTEFAAANGLSGDLLFGWRAMELGPRLNTTTTDMQRYVLGLEGNAAGWDYSAAAVYSANDQEVAYAGSYLYMSRIFAAMRTGLINPWGPSGPEGQALLASTVYSGTPQRADGSTSQVGAYASRELITLPAGPLAVALGAEARRERLSYDWDPSVQGGDSPISEGLQSVSGDRDVWAVYAEASVPIVRTLDAQLAVRHDDYSDFGSTTNPKVALRWQPLANALLRASWGKGFRAPPLYSLYTPTIDGSFAAPVEDPARCPVTDSADDCFGIVPTIVGGNTALQPETSEQWSVGFVLEPVHGLSFGADYWSIRMDDTISFLSGVTALAYPDRFADRIQRGLVDPAYPDLPGPLTQLDLRLINLGATRTSGVDVFLTWAAPAQDWGRLQLGVQGTYVREWKTQFNGIDYVSALGDATSGLPPVPRWRTTIMLDWSCQAWGATLVYQMSTGYVENMPNPDDGTRNVGAAANWDLQGRYTGDGPLRGWSFAAGIQNLFDQDPPFSVTSSFQAGFNPQVGNPLGRTFYVRASYSLR